MQSRCTRYCADMCVQPQPAEVKPHRAADVKLYSQALFHLHMEVHKALCLPRNLHTEVHKALRLPRNLHMEGHKVLCLPRNLHMEVHKVLCLPRNLHTEVHKVLRLPRLLHVKKQVKTPITMEERTGDHRRQPQTTADNATARASNGAWRFTKCCACHEFCTWRFTKCCACHEFCTSRNK